MKTRAAIAVVVLLLGGTLAAFLALYPSLPERMPMHWNIQGKVDGWASRAAAIAIFGGVMLLFLVLITAGEWLSPMNFKIEPFRPSYNYLMVLCAALMTYLFVIVLLAGLHPEGDYGRSMVGGLFLFFAAIANLLGKTKRNFWVGIRTPWTLASDAVWVATHRLGARVLFGVSLLGAIGTWAGAPLPFCFALLLAGLLAPVFYSFWLSKRLEKQAAE